MLFHNALQVHLEENRRHSLNVCVHINFFVHSRICYVNYERLQITLQSNETPSSAIVKNKFSISCSDAQIRCGKNCSSPPQQHDNSFLLHC